MHPFFPSLFIVNPRLRHFFVVCQSILISKFSCFRFSQTIAHVQSRNQVNRQNSFFIRRRNGNKAVLSRQAGRKLLIITRILVVYYNAVVMLLWECRIIAAAFRTLWPSHTLLRACRVAFFQFSSLLYSILSMCFHLTPRDPLQFGTITDLSLEKKILD